MSGAEAGAPAAEADAGARPVLSAAKRALYEARMAGLGRQAPPMRRAPGADVPLSFAQERLWFLDRLQPGTSVYNFPGALRLTGPVDEAALERALGELVRRHEVLRTTFREGPGGPVQVVAPYDGFTLAVDDLSAMDAAQREAETLRHAAGDAARPFDLAAGPLFRARLLRLGADDRMLLLCMHHAVTDAWSMAVLFRELPALYAASREGRASPLPGLAVQYADFAAWQREPAQAAAQEGQLAYWKTQLAGAPELLELPTDRPRPPVPSARGATVPVLVPLEALERLRALGRAEGATLYMVALAAFQVLLGRYAGVEDVVVGAPVAGRTRRELEGLIGLFVNTILLRAGLSGDPPFRALVRQVRGTVLGALGHQDVPFERLVAELHPERSLSHTPLFQVEFQLDDGDDAAAGAGEPAALEAAGGGVRVRTVSADATPARFDLALTLRAHARGISGSLLYATDLFEAGTAARMVRHLVRLLEQAAADPDVRLSGLMLLDDDERARVLQAWNRTDAASPAERCIHGLIEAQAARTPNAAAVVSEDGTLTYAELDARANRLANHLVRLGVGPEVRVGLCLERGLEMVVSLLAVLKAGGAYVPLDPDYPAERLSYMLADSAVPVLLTQDRLRALLPGTDARVVAVDAAWDAVAGERAERPARVVRPENLAYVIYTSGSTGRPKGVMNAHGAVVNRLCWMQAEFGLRGDDAVLQKTPFSFDVSVWEFFWPLMTGARLVMARPEGHRDPVYLREAVERHGITTLHFVPSMLQPFLEAVDAGRCPTLRRVVCSGEALPAALAARFHARWPEPVSLHNLYGPTEAAVDVTAWACRRDDAAGTVPIGRPVWNTRMYVLDGTMQPVPPGVPGELYIGGVQVARGYLGRPGLTAERFVPDPFSPAEGARLYRTGDRARWGDDGTLDYLGRLDAQVKLRGFRVELGEVEAALRAHGGVRDCAVVAREDGGDRRLVAYVAGEADGDGLRAHLRATLPDYMVPSAFVALDALPLTPSGKLDRRALPAPGHRAAEAGYVAPRTPVEEVLAGIWAEVLRVERAGAQDDFFALGGHSLLATRLLSRVRDAFGVEIPLRAVFEAPTPAGLARQVEAALRAPAAAQAPPLVPVPRGGPLPVSFAQQRLWFIQQMNPRGTAYNMPYALRLRGALDTDVLASALEALVRRHESLRTTFATQEGEPVQVIHPPGPVAPREVDLRHLPAAEREARAAALAREEAAHPFDLEAGPLLRATVLRMDEADTVVLLTLHHVVTDGWSQEVLVRDLSELYTADADSRAPVLPELPVQYADYAVWQRAWLSGAVLQEQMGYWRGRLAGAPPLLELPTDRPRTASPESRADDRAFLLSAETSAALRALARGEGATLFITLLAGFQALLSRWSGQDDVVVGTPVAGRSRLEVENVVGFFVNMLALRTDLSGDPSFRALLGRVREGVLQAHAHQELPFEKLVDELQPERSLTHPPLFQVMFTLAAPQREALRLGGLDAAPSVAGTAQAKFDLSLSMADHGERIGGALVYRTDLFDAGTIERMAEHLVRLLDQAAADPGRPLSRLDLLPADERHRVLDAWNRTDAAFPADRCIHALFEAQAERTPGAVAAVSEDEPLTYAGLNARANRLAHHLARLGVGPEARVGLCLERGLEMVVCILAVLKAGGAYVPLDPDNPAERLSYLLADAAVPVLLTQERLRPRLPPADARVVAVDAAWDEIARESAENPPSGATPDGLAYVIYTSGSTGRPKGVMNAHRGVVNRLCWMQAEYALRADDVVLQKTPFGFDVSVWEFFWPLLTGARLVLARPDGHRDPAYLRDVVEGHGVTTLHFVPSMLQPFLEAVDAGRCATLRRVVCSGEALAPGLAARFHARFPASVALHNLYGPTEAAVDVSHWTCRWEDPAGTVPIGRPVWNTRLYVLDETMQPVPPGIPGELYIGGVQVARGYLRRPGLTAERFVPDPFSPSAGARLYRTGDRARWRGDGALEYLGRLDAQVKIRGFRIEPGEVEAALRSHGGVSDCAVVAREDGGDRRLVAYVVGAADRDALRAHLRRTLPEHMMPSAFVALDALPLTPSGKLDRRALPAPVIASPQARYVAPRTAAEQTLAAIWAEVLRVERVGADDSFFDLGGHSLLAVRVFTRVREAFGVEVPLRTLFEHATLAAFARQLEGATAAPAPPIAVQERVEMVLAGVDTLSEEELDRLLNEDFPKESA